MKLANAEFVKSVYKASELPASELPEIAFAGRSNVGKSSLMNCLLHRKNLVKISAKPGKTQSLNFFLVDEVMHLVDLPGYGYAKVPKSLQKEWQELISDYLETRENLRCVVVIIDIRHGLKSQDRELVDWLVSQNIPHFLVYTKADKLSRGQGQQQAALLDSALGMPAEQRIIFSAKTGQGKEKLIEKIDQSLSS
jgi:GTP-binding protein